jgi:hypothetical protein
MYTYHEEEEEEEEKRLFRKTKRNLCACIIITSMNKEKLTSLF